MIPPISEMKPISEIMAEANARTMHEFGMKAGTPYGECARCGKRISYMAMNKPDLAKCEKADA